MAGDVCSQPPHVGRGGWSWYTGAASWMHRAAVESIFGLRLDAQELSFRPALPSHWPRASINLQRDGRSMQFTFLRGSEAVAETSPAAAAGARLLGIGEKLRWPELPAHSRFVISLPDA